MKLKQQTYLLSAIVGWLVIVAVSIVSGKICGEFLMTNPPLLDYRLGGE
jgi:hypothetical protein